VPLPSAKVGVPEPARVVTSGFSLSNSIPPEFADGNGTAASFNYPKGITGDGTYLYVADSSNRRLRRIEIATGEVTTIAGKGSNNCVDSATGTSAKISNLEGLTTDGTNIYLQTCMRVLKYNISSTAVTTIAGSGYQQNDDGTGSSAHFYWPRDSTILGNILYVATGNNLVRAIDISTDPGLNEGVVTSFSWAHLGNNSAITNDGTQENDVTTPSFSPGSVEISIARTKLFPVAT
jgi:hypothetical protein